MSGRIARYTGSRAKKALAFLITITLLGGCGKTAVPDTAGRPGTAGAVDVSPGQPGESETEDGTALTEAENGSTALPEETLQASAGEVTEISVSAEGSEVQDFEVQDAAISDAATALQAKLAAEYLQTGTLLPEATAAPVPPELIEIPEEYLEEAEQPGTLFELYYMTYDSYAFEEAKEVLYKRAIVYLPYGYTTEQKYDVLYWMHGGSHDETYLFGEPEEESDFKHVVDHMVQNGEIEPIIIVCPTYRNVDYTDTEAPDLFNEALELTENFHNELVNDLIPLVDVTFSTYAEGTSREELIAARDHRVFAGYSNGSVATWYTIAYCPEYFGRYLAMSCGIGLKNELIVRGAAKLIPMPFYLWVITGSEDFARDDDVLRVKQLYDTHFFAPPQAIGGNLAFSVGQGFKHGNAASGVYTYNGLRFFFAPDSPWMLYGQDAQ